MILRTNAVLKSIKDNQARKQYQYTLRIWPSCSHILFLTSEAFSRYLTSLALPNPQAKMLQSRAKKCSKRRKMLRNEWPIISLEQKSTLIMQTQAHPPIANSTAISLKVVNLQLLTVSRLTTVTITSVDPKYSSTLSPTITIIAH